MCLSSSLVTPSGFRLPRTRAPPPSQSTRQAPQGTGHSAAMAQPVVAMAVLATESGDSNAAAVDTETNATQGGGAPNHVAGSGPASETTVAAIMTGRGTDRQQQQEGP